LQVGVKRGQAPGINGDLAVCRVDAVVFVHQSEQCRCVCGLQLLILAPIEDFARQFVFFRHLFQNFGTGVQRAGSVLFAFHAEFGVKNFADLFWGTEVKLFAGELIDFLRDFAHFIVEPRVKLLEAQGVKHNAGAFHITKSGRKRAVNPFVDKELFFRQQTRGKQVIKPEDAVCLLGKEVQRLCRGHSRKVGFFVFGGGAFERHFQKIGSKGGQRMGCRGAVEVVRHNCHIVVGERGKFRLQGAVKQVQVVFQVQGYFKDGRVGEQAPDKFFKAGEGQAGGRAAPLSGSGARGRGCEQISAEQVCCKGRRCGLRVGNGNITGMSVLQADRQTEEFFAGGMYLKGKSVFGANGGGERIKFRRGLNQSINRFVNRGGVRLFRQVAATLFKPV